MSLNSWVGIHIWFVWSLNIFIWPPLRAIPHRWRESYHNQHPFQAITKKTLYSMEWYVEMVTITRFWQHHTPTGHKWPKMAWIKMLLMRQRNFLPHVDFVTWFLTGSKRASRGTFIFFPFRLIALLFSWISWWVIWWVWNPVKHPKWRVCMYQIHNNRIASHRMKP